MPARRSIIYATMGLLSFILMIVLLLEQIDPAVADRNSALYDKTQKAQSEFLTMLETLVNIDSGTGDQKGLTQVENFVLQQLKAIGATIETTNAAPSAGRNILATVQGTGKGKILLLAHTDTVFKAGTVAQRPFKIVQGKAYGPGVMDDKGGIILGIEALKILKELNFQDFRTITFLIKNNVTLRAVF